MRKNWVSSLHGAQWQCKNTDKYPKWQRCYSTVFDHSWTLSCMLMWGVISEGLAEVGAYNSREGSVQRCPFVCLKGRRIDGPVFWGMALTSRSGTCINHGPASFSASLLVTFVSRARDRGRRLSIYSQNVSRHFMPAVSWHWVMHKQL